ncbi:hypothetical protein BGX28_009163 [Mortierella sp. GBA30]|nr:hypothetical protein BGX28_009163 [Mortierella sp. GBA30]
MDHINSICRDEGYPIAVEYSPTLGNHALAARDIPQGEGFLRAIPYAAEVFDNFKKRMCHICLLYHNRGSFSFRCQDCDQVYFCSEACKSVAMDPLIGAHPKICRTLRKLATWNSDRHTKSIIKLLLQVLMNHWRERQGMPTAYKSRKLIQEQEQEQEEKKNKDQGLKRDETSDTTVMIQKERLALEFDSKLRVTEMKEDSAETAPPTESNIVVSTKQEDEEEKQNQEKENNNRIQEPVENDFYDVLRLQSHFEDWDEEDTKDWNKQSQIVLSLLEMAGLTEMAVELGGALKTITSFDVKKLISALESNAFGMFDRSKKKPVCFGRAIYPIASFFNHSCECNATAVQADGSAEELKGQDVLGYLDSDDKTNNNTQALTGASGQQSVTQEQTMQTTSSTSSLSSSEETKTLEEPAEEASETDTLDTVPAVDPYDLRVGEFRMMTFFSIIDIKKGQDITISYIDTEMPLQARRLALLSDYHFHCCCERCAREEKKEGKGTDTGGKNKKDKKDKHAGKKSKK